MKIDYRELLKKYINHIGEEAGVTFLSETEQRKSRFTKEEWDELQRLDEESYEYSSENPKIGDRQSDKQPEVKMPEVREICNLIIDSEDLKAAGVSIPEDQLELFEEFLQDFFWGEIDLLEILKKAANEFRPL